MWKPRRIAVNAKGYNENSSKFVPSVFYTEKKERYIISALSLQTEALSLIDGSPMIPKLANFSHAAVQFNFLP